MSKPYRRYLLNTIRSSLTAYVTLSIGIFAHAGTVKTEGADVILNTKGGLELKTANNKYSIELGGRTQWDYNRSELNGDKKEDAFDIRRSRIFLKGNIQDWFYKTQFNLNDQNGGTPADIYIGYKGWGKNFIVTVGRQKEPFGLEKLTSSKDISFLERSAITEAYTPGRNDGISLRGTNHAFTYAIGIFEDDNDDDDDTAFTGRITFNTLQTNERVVHLGIGYTDRTADQNIYDLEAAYAQGPFHIQGEYISADKSNNKLNGYYTQIGWIITGETRPYSDGRFKRIKPNNKAGAWEITTRYENGDGDFSNEELGDTNATSYGFGLNYYANKYIRAGITYTEAKDKLDNDGSELRARLQVAF